MSSIRPKKPVTSEDDGTEPAPPSIRIPEIPRETPSEAPGTLHIESDTKPRIFLTDYGKETVEERELATIDECQPYIDADTITWVDLRGIGHAATFLRLGQIFKIHPLALEDMVNVPQRPKTEVYKDQQLIITRMVSMHEGLLQSEQMAILFGKGFVVTVQEEADFDCLDPLRERIRAARGMIRTASSDYLAYAIFDTVIDGFYPVLEHYGERLEELEIRVLEQKGSSKDIFALKRDLLLLRRAIWPQRDLLASLLRDESPLIRPDTRPYFRDTYDHAIQIMDMVETFRELASSLTDLMMTSVSNRLNEVMKVLTIVSTIFLPMTFVAGVYGMNFDTQASPWNMPELKWPRGYPFAIALMIASAGSLLIYYRWKGWLGTPHDIWDRLGNLIRRVWRKARTKRQTRRRTRATRVARR